MHVRVVLVDYGCNLDPAMLGAVADAATIQMHRDFGRPAPYGYGITATVRVAIHPADIRADEWVLAYLPGSGPGTMLGYHDYTPSGCPLMYVFPSLEDPAMRGLVETHEIIETLVDPWLTTVVPDTLGRLVACEPADPVESSWYLIATRGRWVPVTNFVTPAYYAPQYYPHAPYDFLGQLRYPGEVLPGGYVSTLTPETGWSRTFNGARRPYRAADHASSRSYRRTRRYLQLWQAHWPSQSNS